jgi:hypothetical protein
MDVAKVIVTMFVTKIAVAIGSGLTTALSIVIPISVGIVLIVLLGIGITASLLYLDEKYHLSEHLIRCIKKAERTSESSQLESPA